MGEAAGAELLRVGLGVAGEFEGLDGEDGGGGVVAVGRAGLRREARDDHIGPEGADDADDITEDGRVIPDAEGFVDVFGVTEVEGAGEKLAATIEAAGGEEFLRAGEAELFAELGAALVLAAVAAGDGEVGGAVAAAAGEIGDELGVFVVGVGGDVEDGAEFAEGAEVLQHLRDEG